MKKIISIIFVCICLCCTACVSTNTESIATTPNNSVLQNHVPVYEVGFRSLESFTEFLLCKQMTDEKLSDYLVTHYSDMAGIETRTDAEALLQQISAMPYVCIAEDVKVDSFYLGYRPSTRYCYIIIVVDDIRYIFTYYDFEEFIDRTDREEVGTFEINGETVTFYQKKDGDGILGDMYMDDYYVSVSADKYSDIEQISFAPFFFFRPNGDDLNA